jgi:hypothetical protein
VVDAAPHQLARLLPFDHGNITAILAANLGFEVLSLLTLNRAGAPRSA